MVGEHGGRLSGGERQRLALARTILADFDLLVLDEPTEHVDEATATDLLADLLEVNSERAVLLITHRDVTPLPLAAVAHLVDGRVSP
jgi:ABC-type transport system involved in cytochrome bd biosynthesis fused ATPase/permease subunit